MKNVSCDLNMGRYLCEESEIGTKTKRSRKIIKTKKIKIKTNKQKNWQNDVHNTKQRSRLMKYIAVCTKNSVDLYTHSVFCCFVLFLLFVYCTLFFRVCYCCCRLVLCPNQNIFNGKSTK